MVYTLNPKGELNEQCQPSISGCYSLTPPPGREPWKTFFVPTLKLQPPHLLWVSSWLQWPIPLLQSLTVKTTRDQAQDSWFGVWGVCMYKATSRGQRTTFGVVSFWLPFFEIGSFIDLELQVAPGTLHLPKVGILKPHPTYYLSHGG